MSAETNDQQAGGQGQSVQPVQPAVVPPKITVPAFVPIPRELRLGITSKERNKADSAEAETLVLDLYKDGYFTFPAAPGREEQRIGIIPIPDAAYQRFFFDVDTTPPPLAPQKETKDRKGRTILTYFYDDENYQNTLRAYDTHNNNLRNKQAGDMLYYIHDRGTVFELPVAWVEDYEENLPSGLDLSPRRMKYEYLVELARTTAEAKALTIAICGRDPLGGAEEDEEDGEDGES